MNYWENKQERALKAQLHTIEMQKKYPTEINEAITQTKLYNVNNLKPRIANEIKEPEIIFEQSTSVDAILKYGSETVIPTVLNYASFTNPGGKFINGSSAQEESLCHSSFLYNVLSQFPKYYHDNELHKNYGMYQNKALYTPNVIFDEKQKANVITCAAPNLNPARKYNWTGIEDANTNFLSSRIKFVTDIARDTNSQVLILGAFGCGVFMQNAFEVAQLFRKHLFAYPSPFEKIIFAIPDDDNYNFFYNGWNSKN